MSRYNFGNIKYDENKVKRRFEIRKTSKRRLKTNCGNLDNCLKGFPYGLTLIYGRSGTGKSAFVGRLALAWARAGYKVLYVVTESEMNIPRFPQNHPKVNDNCRIFGMDYTSFRPYYRRKDDKEVPRVLSEVLGGILIKDADVCIIDSFTTLISSNKAIDEADLRDACMTIAKAAEKNLPIICTSQVRGQGQWVYPAGGQGVLHSTQMTLRTDKRAVITPWEAEMYGAMKGTYVYTVGVENDVEGKASQNHEFVIYHGMDYSIEMKSIEEIRMENINQLSGN